MLRKLQHHIVNQALLTLRKLQHHIVNQALLMLSKLQHHTVNQALLEVAHQNVKNLVPVHVLIGVEDIKETVESILQELDHFLPVHTHEVGQHNTEIMLLLTPFQQHQ